MGLQTSHSLHIPRSRNRDEREEVVTVVATPVVSEMYVVVEKNGLLVGKRPAARKNTTS
jgi:hypothetical protein